MGVVDCGRDPLKKFGSEINIDSVPCLRCKLDTLWVLPTEETACIYGERGRFLSLEERCRIYGMCPQMMSGLSKHALTKALGNCIAVPTMTLVLAPLLRSWIELRKLAIDE